MRSLRPLTTEERSLEVSFERDQRSWWIFTIFSKSLFWTWFFSWSRYFETKLFQCRWCKQYKNRKI